MLERRRDADLDSVSLDDAARAYVEQHLLCGKLTAPRVRELLDASALTRPQLMVALTELARDYAHAPISAFHVGAVGLGASGALYLGANLEIENQALNASTHAEQAAIASARLHGEEGLGALAVSAVPCGHCRQFLNELRIGSTLPIYLANQHTTLGALLPQAFGPAELGNSHRMLDRQNHRLRFTLLSDDSLAVAALEATNRCYAPYTLDYAGLALQTASGAVVTGEYLESAAYNPSLSPLQGALVALRLQGMNFPDVTRALLVESASSKCRQEETTRRLLSSVAPGVSLEVHEARPRH